MNSTVKFNNIKKQLRASFTVYADFESILKELNARNKYQEHTACSNAHKIVLNVPDVEFEPRLYVGVDAAEHFIDSLQRDLNDEIVPTIEKEVEMIWDKAAMVEYNNTNHCHICHKELNRDVEAPVRNYCHFSGQLRGAAHQHCNIEYKI